MKNILIIIECLRHYIMNFYIVWAQHFNDKTQTDGALQQLSLGSADSSIEMHKPPKQNQRNAASASVGTLLV